MRTCGPNEQISFSRNFLTKTNGMLPTPTPKILQAL
ncbi:hypothetical protein LINGRAHAP2_LOCUS24152 [Linum grandiflorum]